MATSTDVLDVAAALARGGRYDAALSLLDALPAEPPASEPDLLRAKILAQQKDFEGAAALWRRVLESRPDHKEARRGLATAESLRRRPPLFAFWRAKAAAAFLVLIFGTGLLAAARRQPAAGVEAGESLPAVEVRRLGEIRRLRHELEEARGRLAEDSEPEPPPVLDLGLPGLTVREDDSAVVIGFDEGLFGHGAVLKPDAAPLLAQLAERLAAAAEPISIRVVGHTDPLPVPEGSVYLDNEALGMTRAAVVIGELRAAAELPGKIFQAASLAASPMPLPDGRTAYRLRDRTVTIFVRRGD